MKQHLFTIRICLCILVTFCAVQFLRAQEKIKVACIGNSITYGHGIDVKFQHAYPGILQQMLGKDYEVRNFGMNGRTMLQKGDYPYMFEPVYRQAKDFLPDIVTIKLGTNDSKLHNWKYKKDFQRDMEQMIRELSALSSKPKIYLCTPIPATNKVGVRINDSTIVHGVIPAIRKVAERYHLTLIDLHTPLENHPELLSDKIHPTKEGSAIIAAEIYQVLKGKPAPKCNLEQPFPGVKSQWNGCDRYDFTCVGRDRKSVV